MVCAAALNRKGKGEDVVEDDMYTVVGAHNSKCIVSLIHWEELETSKWTAL